ncbi:MAG: LytTR family transcriptional regulator [Lachnospiraceae bacterium]|nr:LytTR family transcriptional regulator [Lachnospiraceae bacterium]
MNSRIYVSNKLESRFIEPKDVLYLTAVSGRIMVHYEAGGKEKIIDIEGSLKDMEAKLGKDGFLRIHKSYIVNIGRIATVENDWVMLNSKRHVKLPTSRGFLRQLKERLKGRDDVIVL